MLILFESITRQQWPLCEWNPQVLSQFHVNASTMRLSHSLRVLSEVLQNAITMSPPGSILKYHNVFSYSPILTQTLKEIIGYMTRYIVIAFWTFWKNFNEWLSLMVYACTWNCERTKGSIHKVATGCLGDYFQKVISMYPWLHVIELMGTFWKNSPCIAGYFVDTCLRITMKSQCICWISAPFPSVRAHELAGKGHLFSRYIVISLWFLKQCIYKVSSRYMVNSFKKYPSIQSQCNQGVHADYFLKVITKATSGYFVNGTLVFHNFM